MIFCDRRILEERKKSHELRLESRLLLTYLGKLLVLIKFRRKRATIRPAEDNIAFKLVYLNSAVLIAVFLFYPEFVGFPVSG